MIRTLAKTLMALGCVSGSMCALAQINDPPPPFGWQICIDPTNTAPYSNDFNAHSRANNLFRVTIGGSGTVTYGGATGPCFVPALTVNAAGRIGFASGPLGSVQSTDDDDMQYTFGMPISPAGNWSYAVTRRVDTASGGLTSTLFGSAISGNFFSGVSGRYTFIEQTADGIHTQVRSDVLGDGARIRWQMTNLGNAAQLGLWYGALMALLKGDFSGTSGFDPFGISDTGPVFITYPGHKPILVDGRITRNTNPSNFPPYVQFGYGQTTGYGLQVDLGPTSATTDEHGNNSDATNVDELVIGTAPFVIGAPNGTANTDNPPDFVFGDVPIGGAEQFLIKYEPLSGGSIATNGTRNIFSYFRNTWGNSKYVRNDSTGIPVADQPYSTVIDAPHIITPDDLGGGTNGLQNNPFTVRAYVDNTGGYSNVYVSTPLNDVRIKLTLPPGLSFSGGDSAEKVITTVGPLAMQSVDWTVESDGIEVGDLPYTVTITSIPGPPDTKPITHEGIIRVAATKQIKLQPAANLISTPWIFADSSWEAVLGMTSPADFTAYEWDPLQNGYVISTSAARSKGVWLILNPNTHPSEEVDQYNGAITPGDVTTGAPNIQLRSGWNLIGNPYPYAIPISQLVGVSAANAGQAFSFANLVSQNVVTPYLAYWDPSVNNYRYIQGITAMMQPNRGYWVKVLTSQDLTLVFPPVFDTFIPGGRAATEEPWIQTADHWRLNIQGKSTRGQDQENYLGVATGAQARLLQIPEPPQGPTQDVTVSFDGKIANQPSRLAQALSNHGGQLEWRMFVNAKNGGITTLTWPNMSSLPHNIGFRLVDALTHQSWDMRSRSSISFPAAANLPREFRIQTTASNVILPLIGNVTASAGKISTRLPVTVQFGLNYNAAVTVRVLTNQGQQVAVLKNNQSLPKGANTAAWNLKNAAGSYVAAGSYQIEVQATADGPTVRKVVNVAVNR